MNRRELVRKRIVIPVQGIAISTKMCDAAMIIFGPHPPAIQAFCERVLLNECERLDREIMEEKP